MVIQGNGTMPLADSFNGHVKHGNKSNSGAISSISVQNCVQYSKEADSCGRCSYGAYCSGNKIYPKPNYWGYWEDNEVVFLQCPAGYCCAETIEAPCKQFDFCAGNRSGNDD